MGYQLKKRYIKVNSVKVNSVKSIKDEYKISSIFNRLNEDTKKKIMKLTVK